MQNLIATLLLALALLLHPAGADRAAAQGVGSLFPTQGDEPATDLESAIAKAAESGVDSAGRLVTEIGAPQADAVPATETRFGDGSALMRLQDTSVQFRTALIERLLQMPAALQEVLYVLRAASPDGTLWAFGEALVIALSLFGVGMVFEAQIFGKRMMKGFVVSRIRENPQGYAEKMPFLVVRFFVGVLGILVSMVVAYILGFVIFGPIEDTAIQYTATLINLGYFACRFTAILWRMILSPYLSQYRIPALSDRDAKRLHRWLWMVASFDITVVLLANWISELGLNGDVAAFVTAVTTFVVMLINVLMVLVNRRAVSGAIRHGRDPRNCGLPLRLLSQLWAPVAIIYLASAWVSLTYGLVLGAREAEPLVARAYAILISIIVVYGVINYVIERTFARARALRQMNQLARDEAAQEAALEEATQGEATDEAARLSHELEETRAAQADADLRAAATRGQTIDTYEALAGRVAGILALVAGLVAFFSLWQNDGMRMVESLLDQVIDVLVICFIGYVVYHAFRIWIDDKIAEEKGDEEEAELGDEGGGSSASRLATLLPLFRNVVLIVVVASVALIVLMEVGVNVGPLFAGAGIVGVAVGFGSQALVRDIFAGAFFLFDDAFRKGEYIDVVSVKGTVEKISVRSFQLRHHLGALHTIPFGELQVMTNYSRDWVMMKLPLRVTYDTDVDKVRKLVKQLGQELLDDPVIGQDFIQPLKSQGVIEMQDSAMIIRVKFMTKPGDQWVIRKRVYEEIRALFEREGIKFAHREVTVRLADGHVGDLSEEQKKAVTAAAQAGIDDDLLDGGADAQGGDDR
ncbi:MAG: mechanosensitive ion channel family protein [Sulfitobacter sp.]|nr:mechanosensitive ion channel family protein [Sulfitobacter sp.]